MFANFYSLDLKVSSFFNPTRQSQEHLLKSTKLFDKLCQEVDELIH